MAVALSDRDVQAMLGFLYEAAEADGPGVLTDSAVAALFGLIRADAGGVCNVWRGFDRRADPERFTVYDFLSGGAEWGLGIRFCWTEEDDEMCRRRSERPRSCSHQRYSPQPTSPRRPRRQAPGGWRQA